MKDGDRRKTDTLPMGEEVRIRPMREEDIASLMEIERENFSIPWSEESFRSMLGKDTCLFFVAEEQELLGYAGAVIAGVEADVTNIAVRGTEKQKGIGTLLLQHLLKNLAARGATEVFLEVREHNAPALALYRKAGFLPVGRRKGYYTAPKEDAILMKKECFPKGPSRA